MIFESLVCMSVALFFEDRQSEEGMKYISQVILNRVDDPRYPNTVCDVISEDLSGGKKHQCQFSFYCDGLPDRPEDYNNVLDNEAYLKAQRVAKEALQGLYGDLTDATHYVKIGVDAHWESVYTLEQTVGQHEFYINETPYR